MGLQRLSCDVLLLLLFTVCSSGSNPGAEQVVDDSEGTTFQNQSHTISLENTSGQVADDSEGTIQNRSHNMSLENTSADAAVVLADAWCKCPSTRSLPLGQQERRSTRWYVLGGAALAAELVLGFLFWHYFFGTELLGVLELILGGLFVLCTVAHAALQALPLVLLYFGHVSCTLGLPWPAHWLYALALVLSAPMLGAARISGLRIKVPYLGWEGTRAASMYAYALTILHAADGYTDCMAAAIALACSWDKAWALVAVIVQSFVLRVLVSGMMAGHSGAMLACTGALPDAMELFSESREGASYAATVRVLGLITNSGPQVLLQAWFAHERNPSAFVYASLLLSLAAALKAFVKGMSTLIYGDDKQALALAREEEPDMSEE